MGFEGPDPSLVEALGGEQKVDAEAASHPADGVENVRKRGFGFEEFPELVDDHDQVWQGQMRRRLRVPVFSACRRGPGHSEAEVAAVVLADRTEVAGVPKQPLTLLELAGQCGLDPADQVGFLGQVGHQPGHVRQRFEPGEGSAALEVDQKQVEQLRLVASRQCGSDTAQQLALTGAGGADHDPVRAHAGRRRLF